MKYDAIDIIQAAIDAVDPYQCVKSFVDVKKCDDINNNKNDNKQLLLTIGDVNTNDDCNDDDGGGDRDNDNDNSVGTTTSTSTSSSKKGTPNNYKKEKKKKTYDLLNDYDRVVVVAFGKASSAMATSFVQELFQIDSSSSSSPLPSSSSSPPPPPPPLDISLSGVVICKDGHATSEELQFLRTYAPDIQVLDASHPVPDERSVEAAKVLLEHVKSNSRDPRCLVVCCISGGGSALFCSPRPPLHLHDLQDVNRILLASGMSITEMNVIRKRLEHGKGGQLATACYPSTVVTLVLSDVLGDPLDLIASGPTVPDTSTAQDAWAIVEEYNLIDKLPPQVVDVIRQQLVHDEQEEEKNEEDENENEKLHQSTNRSNSTTATTTTSTQHPVFETSQTILVGNNPRAVDAAARKAERLGYYPVVLGTEIDGEAKEIAHLYVAMAKHLKKQQQQQQQSSSSMSDRNKNSNSNIGGGGGGGLFNVAPTLPVALIAGGETTVTLNPDDNKNGKGGRNQEMALSAAILLESSNLKDVVFASAGTDGGDGPTDAAGAVVCADTVRGSREEAMEALVGHDAYRYFDKLGATATAAAAAVAASTKVEVDVDDAMVVRVVKPPPPPLIRTGPTGTNVADVCVTLVADNGE